MFGAGRLQVSNHLIPTPVVCNNFPLLSAFDSDLTPLWTESVPNRNMAHIRHVDNSDNQEATQVQVTVLNSCIKALLNACV
jgi:hypothetical protein